MVVYCVHGPIDCRMLGNSVSSWHGKDHVINVQFCRNQVKKSEDK